MANSSQTSIMWHKNQLPKDTVWALDFFAQQPWLKRSQWYLAGGTALSLQAGHRVSVDLDFFIPKADFAAGKLINHFPSTQWRTTILREGTVYGTLYNAKVSFIAYPFFQHRQAYHSYGAVKVLDKQDVAVMKIIAISQRGTKRDFVDLYWFAQYQEPLFDILLRVGTQYPHVQHNYYHIIKSLVYFEDAEDDPMPKLFFRATWPTIKTYFRKQVPLLLKQLKFIE